MLRIPACKARGLTGKWSYPNLALPGSTTSSLASSLLRARGIFLCLPVLGYTPLKSKLFSVVCLFLWCWHQTRTSYRLDIPKFRFLLGRVIKLLQMSPAYIYRILLMPGAFIHFGKTGNIWPRWTPGKGHKARSGRLEVAGLSWTLQTPKIRVSCLFSLYIVGFSFGEQGRIEREMRYFNTEFPYVSNIFLFV